MSKNIGTITPGTEYNESLSRFLEQEAKLGHISLSGIRRSTVKRNISALTALTSGMAMISAGTTFISTGNSLFLLTLLALAIFVAISVFELARSSGGLFYKMSKIDAPFTQASLLRFVACGVPEDVTRELIKLLYKQIGVSYAQVHDVVWFCGRQASGITENHLFNDRYALIRSRLVLQARRVN